MSKAPELITERLVLREHKLSDLEPLASIWSEAETVRYISGKPATRAESWTRLLRYAGQWPLMSYGYWAISLKRDGSYLGEAGFLKISPPSENSAGDTPEAGWILGREHARQGYALEAMTRILRWADEEAQWPETTCIIREENLRSLQLAKRLGFSKTGDLDSNGKSRVFARRNPGTAARQS